MKQMLLLAIVIVAGVVAIKLYTGRGAASPDGAEAGAYQSITPEDAKTRLDSGDPVILLDVRTQEEYDEGHIPGSVCLPNESITPDMPATFDQDAEIIVYCRSGRRSAEAAGKLADMGYTNVFDLGGIINWPYETTTE